MLKKIVLTPNMRHGLKVGLAAVIALMVTHNLGMQHGIWAVVTAVMAMQTNVAEAVQVGLNRILGFAIGAVLGVGALLVIPDNPYWIGAALFAGTAICAGLAPRSPIYFMASVAVISIILAGLGQPDKVEYGLMRVLDITIGVACAMAVSLLIWPVRLADGLRRDLALEFNQAADILDQLTHAMIERQHELPVDLLADLTDQVTANRERIRKVRSHETMIYHYDQGLMDAQVEAMDMALRHLYPMLAALNGYLGKGYPLPIQEELYTLGETISKALRHLGGLNPKAPANLLIRELTKSVDAAEGALFGPHGQEMAKKFNMHKLMQIFAFYQCLRLLAEDLLLSIDKVQSEKQPAQTRTGLLRGLLGFKGK